MNDHRSADQERLERLHEAWGEAVTTLSPGDVVRAVVRKSAVVGLFCEYGTYEIRVLIPEISWIPSFGSCEQVAAVGDELEVKIVHIIRSETISPGAFERSPRQRPLGWNVATQRRRRA